MGYGRNAPVGRFGIHMIQIIGSVVVLGCVFGGFMRSKAATSCPVAPDAKS